MALIEVIPPEKREIPRRSSDAPAITEATAPLEDDAFLASISAPAVPAVLKSGEPVDIAVKIKNVSEFVWPARGRNDYTYLITVSNGWLDEDGSLIDNTDGKNGLPHDLWPDEELTLTLRITPPTVKGEFILEIDLVQEGIAWFKDKGSQPFRTKIKVE